MTHPIPPYLRAACAFARAGYDVNHVLAVCTGDCSTAIALLYDVHARLLLPPEDGRPSSFVVRYDSIPAPTPDEHPALSVLRAAMKENAP